MKKKTYKFLSRAIPVIVATGFGVIFGGVMFNAVMAIALGVTFFSLSVFHVMTEDYK